MIGWILTALALPIGGLIYGVERKMRARMQRRTGASVLQPFYDCLKLLDKRTLIIHNLHAWLGVLHFFGMYLAVAVLLTGGDLLMAVFIHLTSSCFLVVGGYSVRSVYSQIGGMRELLAIMAYEPIFLLAGVGFYLVTGSFEAKMVFAAETAPFTSLWLLFLGLLIALPMQLKKSPFDMVEAHQEIIGGAEIEYSGIFYMAVYMTRWLEYVFSYVFIALFCGTNHITGFALAAFVFLLLNLLDNATARLNWRMSVPIVLAFSLAFGFINIAWIGL